MTQASPADLAGDLEAFSQRLEARIREFKARGEFKAVHEAVAEGIRKRQGELSKNVNEAIRNGTAWDVIKTEFQRDYGSLFDDWMRWEEHLDAEWRNGNK